MKSSSFILVIIFFYLLGINLSLAQSPSESSADQLFFAKAEKYRKVKLFDKAVLEYESAILVNPNEAKYFAQKGICLAHLKSYKKAAESFKTALKLNPDDEKYFFS